MKTGIEPEHQQLIYIGKYMQDKNTLADYDTLRHGSNIMLVMRLHGGGNSQSSVKQETPSAVVVVPTRNIHPSLPRSRDDCIITLENFKEHGTVVLKMPCSHAICPDALMDYAWSEVSTNKKTKVKCPMCPEVWSFDVIKRYGGATTTELDQLELGISQNFCVSSDKINQCPKCNSYCTRINPNVNSVKCIICSNKDHHGYHFCWYCLRDWKTPLSSQQCGNDCSDVQKLAQLRNSGKVRVDFLNMEIFKLRACPKCGSLIELKDGCKHVRCEKCKIEFCFVCLRRKNQGSWSCGSFDTTCEPAPIQTKIPRQ